MSFGLFFAGPVLPISFVADGTNVDVAVVEPTNDAGTVYGIFVGIIPESQLFTFNPATALKPLFSLAAGGPNACFAAYPGAFVALLPTTSGMDLYMLDLATATVRYSATGASNILHGDSEIVACGMGTANITSSSFAFNVIWTENAGNGQQNLLYAPLQCTQQ